MKTVELFRTLREAHLNAILALLDDTLTAESPTGSTLVPMGQYHLRTGGKRLRALLPLVVAERLGHDPASVIPFGAACEMLHNATLVHDDLQDGDTLRRGQATVWSRYGMPQAINLGDAMFYYALLLVQRLDASAEVREVAARRLMRETLRVIDGQEQEFALMQMESPTLADYTRMVEGKTSGLFALPMSGAAELCGAPAPVVAALAEAARHLGILFQIQDDVLDLYADKGRNERASDIKEGKRSILAVHGLSHAPEAEGARLRSILDTNRQETSDEDVQHALEILERAGSRRYALEEIEKRRQAAIAVPGLAENTMLVEVIEGIAELFLEPIRSLLST